MIGHATAGTTITDSSDRTQATIGFLAGSRFASALNVRTRSTPPNTRVTAPHRKR